MSEQGPRPKAVVEFERERREAIAEMSRDEELKRKSLDWMLHADRYKYTYNFRWLGRPIIKYPQDILALQEAIWSTRPDLIVETGIAHGGSLVFSASMLELLGGDRQVVGIDIDIRAHNRAAIEAHPMARRITMIEGSSVDEGIVRRVAGLARGRSRVMVCLDSLHTHDHVLRELRLYSPLVSVGCHLVLPDTLIELFPRGYYAATRPWDVGNNPMTALREFLEESSDFVIDHDLLDKLLITEGVDGYLKRVR